MIVSSPLYNYLLTLNPNITQDQNQWNIYLNHRFYVSYQLHRPLLNLSIVNENQHNSIVQQNNQQLQLYRHISQYRYQTMNTSQQQQQPQQFTSRDDIIKFSSEVMASARNRFRKKQHSRNNSNNISTELVSTRHGHRGNTAAELVDVGLVEEARLVNAGDRVGRYFGKQKSAERGSFTAINNATRNKSYSNTCKISKTQSMQVQKLQKLLNSASPLLTPQNATQRSDYCRPLFRSFNQSQQSSTQLSFTSVQRKYTKNGLSQSVMQSWLNEALIQASPNLSLDRKQHNAGLQAYRIDRSSLLTKGINPVHVDRLYRSVFVYSLGFNNLLTDLCNQNNELKHSIWRVFALLLEYCSEGNFETMIGELQRDKQNKLAQMRQQIANRQKIIDSNQEVSAQKNAKIIKEIRELQQETKDLQTERQVILHDFHQAEQAFNEQIALRLKYETKINEIHGVYGQLQQKYKLLQQEHTKNVKDLNKERQTVTELKKNALENKVSLDDKINKISQFERQRIMLYETLGLLQNSSKNSGANYMSVKNSMQSLSVSSNSKDRQIAQLQLLLANSQTTQKSLLETMRSKHEQFQKAMRQNAQLHEHVHKNIVIINNMAQEKRELGHRSTEIQALMAIQVRKLHEKDAILKQCKKQLEHSKEELGVKELDLAAEIARNQTLEKDLQSCHANIKQMKGKQNELNTLLDEANNKINLLHQSIQSKKNQEQKYIIAIQSLKSKNQQLRTEVSQKNSKITILEDQIKAQHEIAQIKYHKLEEAYNKLKQRCTACQKQRDALYIEIESNREKHEKMFILYKNQKFERNNLDLYYKQSLAVMEEEIEHIKKLSIEISKLNEIIEQSKRRYAALQLIHQHKTEMLAGDVAFWKTQFEARDREVKQRKIYIHPSIYEDIAGSFLRLKDKYEVCLVKVGKLEKNVKQLQQDKIRIQLESKNSVVKENQSSQSHYKNQLTKRDSQLKFIKQKLAYQIEKHQEANDMIAKIGKQRTIAVEGLAKVQTQFMYKVAYKDKQLQEINEKYRTVLLLNQEQLSQSHKITNKHQHEKKELHAKIQELSHQIKNLEQSLKHHHINSAHKQKPSKHLKPEHVQHESHQKPKKTQQSRLNSVELENTPNADQRTGWPHEENEQNYEQDDNLVAHQARDEVDENRELTQKQQSVENFKKREAMRKKIKGAYLYYRH